MTLYWLQPDRARTMPGLNGWLLCLDLFTLDRALNERGWPRLIQFFFYICTTRQGSKQQHTVVNKKRRMFCPRLLLLSLKQKNDDCHCHPWQYPCVPMSLNSSLQQLVVHAEPYQTWFAKCLLFAIGEVKDCGQHNTNLTIKWQWDIDYQAKCDHQHYFLILIEIFYCDFNL